MVVFDHDLRNETEALVQRLHEHTRNKRHLRHHYSKKCDNCSLLSLCLPRASAKRDIDRYLSSAFVKETEKI